jgi:hypothetical protein
MGMHVYKALEKRDREYYELSDVYRRLMVQNAILQQENDQLHNHIHYWETTAEGLQKIVDNRTKREQKMVK